MKKVKKSIPDKSVFTNRAKEARFWGEHFDEAWTSGKPIKAIFAKNLSATVNIRLDPKILTIVREEAKAKGLGPTQLVRMWIMEKISERHTHPTRI